LMYCYSVPCAASQVLGSFLLVHQLAVEPILVCFVLFLKPTHPALLQWPQQYPLMVQDNQASTIGHCHTTQPTLIRAGRLW
jgi:hypothetical protein